MMNSFQQKLLSRYPTLRNNKEMCYSALVISVLVYFFLAVFQPFGTYNFHHTYKYVILLAYPLIAFTFFFSSELIVKRFFDNWNWKKEVYKNMSALLICAFISYLYLNTVIHRTPFNLTAFLYLVAFTLVIGIPICAINILAKYVFLKNNNVLFENSSQNFTIENIENPPLVIIPDVGDCIKLSQENFLYAKSDGNYSFLHYFDKGTNQRKLLRLSLKSLEEQICDETIFRCHRSYILNANKIQNKTGNSQGYKLSLIQVKDKIPVSRIYIEKIDKQMF
ncbi:LytTR family DNA-binding domain-containing protein [Psychroflexus lacisalsi]|uniref:LytTR family DNA-binding domain-containing protein n=2 Tax=Psychroflexus lacisalsi TaxID=503928 RepID=UPI0031D15D8E